MADEKLHCVFVGIDEYRDSAISPLRCAARDAEEMGDLFEGIRGQVTLITNTDATALALRRAIWGLARRVSPGDTAIVFYAGHGTRVSVPQRRGAAKAVPCVVPYDAHHEDLLATGIAMDELGRAFESIPCKRVLFLFDSCYSGGIAGCRSFLHPGERAIGDEEPVFPTIAGEGMVVLAASTEYQPAFEDQDTGHGVFTEFLIEALSGSAASHDDTGVGLDDVHRYLQRHVPSRTQRRFNTLQTPVQHGTFTERFVFPVMRRPSQRTLMAFPRQFLPLTVVVGDRRESTPKTAGDLFALSASAAELRWLPGLRLPPDAEIVSDKIFVQGDADFLRKHYGERNLLVIGSPAANLVARLVNESALFPFSVPTEARAQYQKVAKDIAGMAHNRTALVNFATDSRNRESLAFYMNLFRKGGFIDPTYSHHRRGDRIPHDRDYGTVTLARNPFADRRTARYVSILAAGVCLPGTMHSLRLLRDARTRFVGRPLGGVFSVELTELDWVRRVTEGSPEWSTEEYDVAKLRRGLTDLLNSTVTRQEFSKQEIEDRLALLEAMSEFQVV